MNLLKAASTVSVLTLASRITGLIRESLIAGAFGASALTDAFNVAWRIPNLLPRWFAAHGIEPIYAAACGTVVGGVLQLAVQLPALRRIGYLPRLGVTPARIGAAWRHAGVRRVLGQMGPAILGVSVAQISLLINTHI